MCDPGQFDGEATDWGRMVSIVFHDIDENEVSIEGV